MMLAWVLVLAFIGFVAWVAFSAGHYLGTEEMDDAYERGRVDERRRIERLCR